MKIDSGTLRQPSAASSFRTISEWLNNVSNPEIFFLGNEEEYMRFVCHLERLGQTIGNFEMPNEKFANSIDDNDDQFIDNTYGWNGIKIQPYLSKKNMTPSQRTVAVYPFLMNHPIPLRPTRSTAGIVNIVDVAMAFLQEDRVTKIKRRPPIYVFIPDENDRKQFIETSASQLEIFGYQLEPCGALTN